MSGLDERADEEMGENVPRGTSKANGHEYYPFDPEHDDPWPIPIDLWEQKPVPRLKPEWLPQPLRAFVADQSELIGTDPTIMGIGCLVACAGVIDDGFRVQPKEHDTGWTESARLWGAVVGEPASRKSPPLAAAIRPMKRIEARLSKDYELDHRQYEDDLRKWERNKSGDKGEPPRKPPAPRVLVDDTTIEALSDVLKDNPKGIFAFRDELSGWFGAMDAYSKNGSSKDRSFWLEAYNGGGRRIDRVLRGHIYVPNCSVSLLGGIQPDVFAKIIRRLDEDGLLQRFMIVIGSGAEQDADRAPNHGAEIQYIDLIENLYKLKPREDVEVFTLTPEAQAVRRVWMSAVRQLIDRSAAPKKMLGYLGKWEGLFARLLCTYHVVNCVGQNVRPTPTIDESVAMNVCELMECLLLPHAMEFYDNVVHQSERSQHYRWIASFILAYKLAELPVRDVLRNYKGFSHIDDNTKRGAWVYLEDAGWIRPSGFARTNKRSGIPTRWDVNPEVHKMFAARAAIELRSRQAAMESIHAAAEARRNEKCGD
ncbi:MAG TPA: DUF3987 domain-containing protein [Burkholderiales bacterium]|nr:DUF3987 domain-containing protein [Burkholderiales bacterium]